MRTLAEAGGDPMQRFLVGERARREVDPSRPSMALRYVERGLSTKKVKEQREVFTPFLFQGQAACCS